MVNVRLRKAPYFLHSDETEGARSFSEVMSKKDCLRSGSWPTLTAQERILYAMTGGRRGEVA